MIDVQHHIKNIPHQYASNINKIHILRQLINRARQKRSSPTRSLEDVRNAGTSCPYDARAANGNDAESTRDDDAAAGNDDAAKYAASYDDAAAGNDATTTWNDDATTTWNDDAAGKNLH